MISLEEQPGPRDPTLATDACTLVPQPAATRWEVTLRNGLLSLQLLSALGSSRELHPLPAWHSQRASPSPALWKHPPLSSKQDYLLLVQKCLHSRLENLQGGLLDTACVATVC